MMMIMLMMIFVHGQWHWTVRLHLNRIKIISESLKEMHLMKMPGLYLMALIGKNLPVLLLVSK